MTAPKNPRRTPPFAWVPTLYFAEGVPFFAVSLIAGILYKRLGLGNDVIALYTKLLLLPWSSKPLWSPLLEMFKTKKYFVVLLQLVGGISLGLIALCLPLPGYFLYTIGLFAVVAFCSSTHDIAADGLYIASLSSKEQAAYAGWQSGFYSVARLFSQGGLIVLAGYLEARMDVPHAWMAIFASMGLILASLSLYHSRVLPSGGAARHSGSPREIAATFRDVLVSFLRKPNIYWLLLFILLYRAGEGQVVTIGPLFLVDKRSAGGLGLSMDQFGTIYGTFGTLAFLAGTVLGGYFTSWLGLRRALLPLVCALNFPNLAYVYLSAALPTNPVLVASAMSVEMFGYGFGFVGVVLLMMQEIAPGKYQTAHYAFANSLMNLGLMIPGAVSGKIQVAIGYRKFFVWVLISSVPALILSHFIPIGRRATQAAPDSEAQPTRV
ncbi:MAG: MFS transporter [Bryobacteraceae bacterium]|jgi:PAT family beta-lactamase induction signal transducer AmpG